MIILRKFGCHSNFIATLQQCHTGMCAQVVMDGSQSSRFPVEVTVIQGCVLAPIIFKLFLVAMTLVSHRDLQSSDCIGIEYRLDGGFFNLRCRMVKAMTYSAVISALQYADDATFPSLTVDRLQSNLDVMSETYFRAGLIINKRRYRSIVRHHMSPHRFPLAENSLKTQKILFTWAQISNFLVTSQMRSKDALILLH